MIVSVAAATILVGFWLLPTEPVSARKVTSVTYKSVHVKETTESSKYWTWTANDATGERGDVVTETHPKSGFRRSLEGRLKWLGVADAVSIPLPCSLQHDHTVVCRYL
jgi:hypothetical protein